MKKFNNYLSLLSVAFSFLFLVAILVFAQWSPPTSSPPQGNVPPPINVGSQPQSKNGRLGVNISSIDNNYALTIGGGGMKLTNPGTQPTLYLEDQASDPSPFVVDADGRVGIGTTNPAHPLHVVYSGNVYVNFQNSASGTYGGLVLYNGNTPVYFSTNGSLLAFFVGDGSQQDMVITNSGYVGIGTISPAYRLDVAGEVRATAFYYASDLAFKTNVNPLQNSLEKILNLQGVSFQWKNTNEKSIGLIAQEVEKIIPEIVSGKEGGKTIDYGKLIPVLIEAIKEQQKEIERLKAEIESLKGR